MRGVFFLLFFTFLFGAKLSVKEMKEIVSIREDEKLCEDVYKSYFLKFKNIQFKNISSDEQKHSQMAKYLISKYRLYEPVGKRGFKNENLNLEYEKLKAARDLKSALENASFLEEGEIKDLQNALDFTDNDELKSFFSQMLNDSKNHLRVFVTMLRDMKIPYTPKILSKQQYRAIFYESGADINKTGKIQGIVKKYYEVEGIKKGNYWWVVNVDDKRVIIANKNILPELNINIGDKISVEGYEDEYGFVSCGFKNLTNGFEFKVFSKRCETVK